MPVMLGSYQVLHSFVAQILTSMFPHKVEKVQQPVFVIAVSIGTPRSTESPLIRNRVNDGYLVSGDKFFEEFPL
jgi:hypothetical protein